MNINNLLNQVLGAGQELTHHGNGNLTGSALNNELQNMLSGESNTGLSNILGSILGGGNRGNDIGEKLSNLLGQSQPQRGSSGISNTLGSLISNTDLLKKIGGGAAAAGVLSMLLGGSNGQRNIGGSIAKMGSLAAIGTLAYNAYKAWQSNTQSTNESSASLRPSTERTNDETERNSQIILKAMVAAACADGELSDAEQQAILHQISNEDKETATWLTNILKNPPSVDAIALEVGNDTALAMEVYLSSRIVCGDLDRRETIFLAQLQKALGLNDALVEQLEKQAGF